MALSKRDSEFQKKLVDALCVARTYLEPHPSWESERLHREALDAVRNAVGTNISDSQTSGVIPRQMETFDKREVSSKSTGEKA